MTTFVSARTPHYNAAGTIDLLAAFSELGEVPFTAAPGDAVAGPIYTRAIAGEFGDVAAYAAPEQTALELWLILQQSAQIALSESDICVLRCYEHSVYVPEAWVIYRAELRTIISTPEGDATAGLPVRPDYPAGT